jgi:NTE family protein
VDGKETSVENIGPSASTKPQVDRDKLGQVVLVMQGGGALGSYQAGVYQALQESGFEPDWVIGTSIGAVNAALIAGNPPERRVPRLREFWDRVHHKPLGYLLGLTPFIGPLAANSLAMWAGAQGFFEPNPWAYAGPLIPLGAERAGYYSLGPLEISLAELADEKLFNAGRPRLTVGAANVRTSEISYFDSQTMHMTARHVKASAATPPTFPPVRIGDDFYWDGGIVSNSPVEAVFDDKPRRSGVIFAVHMWSPNGEAPDSILRALAREKELLYSSRATSQVARQQQIHKLRHVINEMAAHLPRDIQDTPEVRALASYGCMTQMHVVRLVAPPLAGDDHSNELDFSAEGIEYRWNVGYADTMRALGEAHWAQVADTRDGFIMHEAEAGHVTFEG